MSYWGAAGSLKRLAKTYLTPSNVKKAKFAGNVAKATVQTIKGIQKSTRKGKNKSALRRKNKYRKGASDDTNDDHTGFKRTHHVKVLNKRPKYRKGLQFPNYFNTYEEASPFSFASSTGTVPGTNQLNRQRVFDFATYADSAQLLTIMQLPYTSSTAAFAALDPTVPGGTSNSGKFLYGGVSGNLEFTNQEQGNMVATIYMCIAKQNFPSFVGPAQAWETSIDENAGFIRTIANVNTYMPNSVPTGKYFRSRWTIVQKSSISMAAGTTHKHSFRHTVNKTLDISTIRQFQAIKDVTMVFLITMRGMVVDFDAVQTHGPATLIGYAPTKIVGISTSIYRSKTCAAEPPKNIYQNNSISGTAPTAVWDINDEDGKPVNIFAATNAA